MLLAPLRLVMVVLLYVPQQGSKLRKTAIAVPTWQSVGFHEIISEDNLFSHGKGNFAKSLIISAFARRKQVFMLYSHYLQTPHWQNTRNNNLNRQPKCVFCDSVKSLQIHHKAYEIKGNNILFNELPKNLYTVCASCHRLVHRWFGINVNKLNKKKLRVRRLLELGVKKNKAFWIVATDGLWDSVYPELLRRS